MNNTPFKPGDQVSFYGRDSGGESQELSVSQQLTAFHQFCQENGLIPGAIFQDIARPGSSVVGRDGFHAMMDHFRHNAPEAGLVIWSYSRFARDFDDAAFYRADLRRRGYILHSLNDAIPDGHLGRLFEAVIDWKNQTFLEDLSRDVKRGLTNLVERYGAVPGTPPRGFKREPVQISTHRDGRPRIVNRWVPDPEKISLVRQAFDMLLSGASLAEIQTATHLYSGINSWGTFFQNPLYIGILKYGQTTIENYCDPIIDPLIWQRAQAIIAQRAHHKNLPGDNPTHPRRLGSVYLLSGLAYCARCNSPLCGSTKHELDVEYRHERYLCTRFKRNRDCDAEGIPRLFLEDLVIKIVSEQILTPENLYTHRNLLQQTENEKRTELESRATVIRQQLGAVRRRIGNITETIAEEGRSRALLKKLTELETAETGLLSELSQLDVQLKEPIPTITDTQIETMVATLRAELLGPNARRVLRGLIKRILVERTGQTVSLSFEYYYPPEEKPPPADDIIPTCPTPVGAPSHRYTFSLVITVPFKRKKWTARK